MTAQPSKNRKSEETGSELGEIYRKLEERAIAESNDLNRRVVQCRLCRRGDYLPTVGSGHPLADVLLVKYRPRYQETSEGVAFFGRSGGAVLKSVERLGVDPLLLYGTNVVKCAGVAPEEGEVNCPAYLFEELHITQPKLVVIMGRDTLEAFNRQVPEGMGQPSWDPGSLQDLTPFCRVIVTPDIDGALDDADLKRAFWAAFRTVGDWFKDEPPY
jgi:uracil-DNA glycosylase family 4